MSADLRRELSAAIALQAYAGTRHAAAYLRCRGWSLASALFFLT